MSRRPPPLPPPLPPEAKGDTPVRSGPPPLPGSDRPPRPRVTTKPMPVMTPGSSAKAPAPAPAPTATLSQNVSPAPTPVVKTSSSTTPIRTSTPEPASKARTTGAYKAVTSDRSFGRFELLMEMAKGGMATLYLARIRGPEQFEKTLVIKKIHDHLAEEEEFIRMFLDEARITALIHHPNVATIFDMGQIQGAYFIAMDYVHGENMTALLRAAVRQSRSFQWPYAASIVASAAAGLHAAHELKSTDGKLLGVVHRDVSPQNILVSYDGHVKVVDFGIAYAAERISHTSAGTLKGKVAYMSPEQTGKGKLDRRSDVFSLGIVLYECVVLKRLFKEESEAAALLRVREADVPHPRTIKPDIPEELEAIILKCLARDPDDRFASAGELEDALNRLLVAHGHVVGHQQIGKLMEKLFYQRRKLKDEQIQRSTEGTGAPVRGFGMSGTSTTLEPPPTDASLGSQRLNQPAQGNVFIKLAIAMAAVLTAAVLVLVAVLIFRDKTPQKQAAPPPTREAPPRPDPVPRPMPPPVMEVRPVPPRPETFKLRVVVQPSTAPVVVEFQGKKKKGASFEVVVPRSDKQEQITVSADGYKKQVLTWVPTEAKEFIITLEPKPARTRRPRDRLMDLPE